MPERIRLSRAKGWRLPPNAVNAARPGKWGNLFVVGRDGTQAQCVGMFVSLARDFIALAGPDPKEQLALYQRIRRSVHTLRGRDIACWCRLGTPCHGDILLHLANPGLPLPPSIPREIELPRVRIGLHADDFAQRLGERRKAEAAHG